MNPFQNEFSATVAREYHIKGKQALIDFIDEEFTKEGEFELISLELHFPLPFSSTPVVLEKRGEEDIGIWRGGEIWPSAFDGQEAVKIMLDNLVE